MNEPDEPLRVSTAPGLYLHVPFCSRICPYCDFAVQVGGPKRRALFVESLLGEIRMWGEDPEIAEWAFDTLYFGGGTPSLLSSGVLEEIFAALRTALSVAPETWIHFEANPEDVTSESLRVWRELGVRTLSLGIQSLDAGHLSFLGRRHGPEQAQRSVALAREAGFDTVSLDLIYGLPQQSAAGLRRELAAAVALAPDHLSCYQLTVHEDTPFGRRAARGELVELPEGHQAELFEQVHRSLADAGYPAYEVSNFARAPEHRSKHNPKYWRHVPYLGLGPSAHSFGGIEGGTGNPSGRRWWNQPTLTRWAEGLGRHQRPVAGFEDLDAEQLALEELALALRTPEGLDLDTFRERWGWDPKADAPACLRLVEAGYLEESDRWMRPTLRGLAVADGLVRELSPGRLQP